VTLEKGLTASVMDYVPPAIFSGSTLRDLGGDGDGAVRHYFSPVIGPYDVWAIRFGYTETKGEVTGLPHPSVLSIAEEASNEKSAHHAELQFGSDEDLGSEEDPRVQLYDLGSSPSAWWEEKLRVAAEIRSGIYKNGVLADTRAVKVGDSWSNLASLEGSLLRIVQRSIKGLLREIGGIEHREVIRSTAGYPVPPMAYVPREAQDAVLQTLLDILGDDGMEEGHSVFGPPSYYMYMQQKTGVCDGLEQYCLGRSSVDLESQMVNVKLEVLEGLLRYVI
jgi:hypothetical protein